MFDIGFLELLICAVIALLVLGPERLPTAARAAGRWVGAARRMVSQFSSELDRQLKAEELREELRKAGDVGLDDVQKTVRGALDEAKKYEHMILPDGKGHQQTPMSKGTAADAAPSETSGDQDDSPTPDNSSAPKQVPPGSPDKRS
ncbi:twin-arginine translocation protein subunit TatB [Marinobacter santoriniensis NKSG1]|uniref:Sec-independent protein translocase protein TatB n=1 Tax=Marinobacter santoriniensis NKSG1 TaxID=1288826 RepID=M7CPR1_9GAMM|nr:Sec-independent protein translocase protein TatB [Marinobacter santoriniensis]EMP55159.1 twin-arginine translocation protein subunit TatB [Marinobacter santoriniensis NKSG1]